MSTSRAATLQPLGENKAKYGGNCGLTMFQKDRSYFRYTFGSKQMLSRRSNLHSLNYNAYYTVPFDKTTRMIHNNYHGNGS